MSPSMAMTGMAICMASTQYQKLTLPVAIMLSMRMRMCSILTVCEGSMRYICRYACPQHW